MWVQGGMVSKFKMHENTPLHIQESNYREGVYELNMIMLGKMH
jgi:hypothetical protein